MLLFAAFKFTDYGRVGVADCYYFMRRRDYKVPILATGAFLPAAGCIAGDAATVGLRLLVRRRSFWDYST